MASAPVQTTPIEASLTPDASRRVIDAALRGGAVGWVRIQAPHRLIVRQVETVAWDDMRLTLQSDDARVIAQAIAEGGIAEVAFECDGGRYAWNVAAPVEWRNDQPDRLLVERPEALRRCDRRRSPRRALRESSVVTLRPVNDRAERCWLGFMLNVSELGFACRLQGDGAPELGVGEAVGYAYGPATSTDRTEGRCRVVGVTPGGSTGAWILGMEFVSPEGEASGAAT